jgi:probable 2-oxoglutarate dehydrogenase E1 component DHKTD1
MRKELNPSLYGFKVINNELFFDCDGVIHLGGKNPKRYANLMEILNHLRETYCKNIAAMFMHLDTKEQNWIARELEAINHPNFDLTPEEEIKYFQLLQDSETFDQYLGKKFTQTKRYGLEGSEAAMIGMDKMFETIAKSGYSNVVIGMPHRGRLNFMTGLLNYPPHMIFHKTRGHSEFPPGIFGTGDVLSHLGTTATVTKYGQPIKISLMNNPSHLEAIDPVALGKTRAKIDDGKQAVCVMIHGDSAFSGQGIIMETLGLENLPNFSTQGTIHVIFNNQLGFTTPKEFTRSTRYSADIGKMIDTPIFVVNGEKIGDIAKVMDIAVRYKDKFKKDVIVEIVGYRKHGHNELDEPGFTQPFMYKIIRSRPSIVQKYAQDLIERKILTQQDIEVSKTKYEEKLNQEYNLKVTDASSAPYYQGNWKGFESLARLQKSIESGYDIDELTKFGIQSVTVPKHFSIHPRLTKYHIEPRLDAVKNDKPLDWATVEAMAFGSIVKDGFKLRLSGQDVGRGTFSQRHLVFANQDTTEHYCTLEPLGKFSIVPSPLSELAVLGFEYGYTLDDPKNLCIWEAQFGDFSLNAQTIIDQFICSGEEKWNMQSSIVMLLPHGFDGAGPEHSSCRIERYLQLCNSKIGKPDESTNMYVINPTTPANYFHALRRQILFNYRKPLIVAGPKQLLRHEKAVSKKSEMGPGTRFHPILVESNFNATSVILCSGKIYYELAAEREKRGVVVDIIRLEELNPFPYELLSEHLSKYKKLKNFRYVQEEPENQGAFYFVKPRIAGIEDALKVRMEYVGREASGVPATGISSVHKKEVEKLFNEAFSQ